MKQWRNPGKRFSHGITIDPDGLVWLPETDGGNHLNAFDSKTEKFVGRYNYNPDDKIKGVGGRPARGHTPVLDSKQNVWVSMIHGDHIIKWDRQTKETSVYKPDSYPSQPYGIDRDSKDNIWTVLSLGPPRVGKFDPKTEKWTEYPALTTKGRMRRLGVDSKDNVWYGIHTGGVIGRIDGITGKVTEYKVPLQFSKPYDIQADAQDNMWFGDSGMGGMLGKYEPKTGKFTFYPEPQVTDNPKLEITREGAIWYCPRSGAEPGVGVLYPDVTKITTLRGFYRGYDMPTSKWGVRNNSSALPGNKSTASR
jgi:streptogramin lyase